MAEEIQKPLRGDYRSAFEYRLALFLWNRGVPFQYETECWSYWKDDIYKVECLDCGSTNCVSHRTYTPDFILPNGIVIEAKGKATPAVRTQLEQIKASNPDRDLRIVFMNDNWLTKKHKKRYSDWAVGAGFDYAVGGIPDGWLV